jgi:hypothetical protein
MCKGGGRLPSSLNPSLPVSSSSSSSKLAMRRAGERVAATDVLGAAAALVDELGVGPTS